MSALESSGDFTRAQKEWLFLYGPELHPAELRRRGVVLTSCEVAELSDFRLEFHGYSRIWDGAQATARKAPGARIWGILCPVSFSTRDTLDAWQDVRMDGSGTYFHYPVQVRTLEGSVRKAYIYVKDQCTAPRLPSAEYLQIIVQGAREQNLPQDYIHNLENLDFSPASYEVPRYGPHQMEMIRFALCSDCGF